MQPILTRLKISVLAVFFLFAAFGLTTACDYDDDGDGASDQAGDAGLDENAYETGSTDDTSSNPVDTSTGSDTDFEESTEYLVTDQYSVYHSGNRYVAQYYDTYMDDVQAIFSKRCASCHSCNSGPCQLNLTSYEGLSRGMSKENPHDLTRLFKSAKRARLSDHYSVEKYRSMDFHPVVNQSDFIEENEDSIMYLALKHGKDNPPRAKPRFENWACTRKARIISVRLPPKSLMSLQSSFLSEECRLDAPALNRNMSIL